jgi:hypothetical protein
MGSRGKITVRRTEITLFCELDGKDNICTTGIARHRNSLESKDAIRNWTHNRNTVEFSGLWKPIHDLAFTMSQTRRDLINKELLLRKRLSKVESTNACIERS